ncbi:MAG: hypothetical protein P4M00_10025 [Azospirillaceae bacterium]|nr:hypothetical protein [Azospirillaceae bacterium]
MLDTALLIAFSMGLAVLVQQAVVARRGLAGAVIVGTLAGIAAHTFFDAGSFELVILLKSQRLGGTPAVLLFCVLFLLAIIGGVAPFMRGLWAIGRNRNRSTLAGDPP